MRISKKTQYGLRAMARLAVAFQTKNKICSIKDISEKENISFDYLEKIISELERKGFLKSKRGAAGGYYLSRAADKINVGEIFRALESTTAVTSCLAQASQDRFDCPRRKKCKTIDVWKKIQDSLNSTLESMTLKDLI